MGGAVAWSQPARSFRAVGLAAAVGLFQLVGSFGAAHDQPDRRPLDALAIGLLLAGPVALAGRERRPLVAVAVSAAAADLWVARGYPYGPIFLSVVVALFGAVAAGRRRSAWALAAAAFAGFVVASLVDPHAGPGEPGPLKLALVVGWLVVVLAVAEIVRARREQVAERARNEAEARRRRAGEQRLELARELHDVLAHNISLINVQASVALHLFDEHPEQARPTLANIKAASGDALGELRSALDVLRRGVPGGEAAAGPARGHAVAPGAEAGNGATEAAPGSDRPSRRSRPADRGRQRQRARRAPRPWRGPRTSGPGHRARRVPHRAGGAHQRHPPRAGPDRHRAGRLRRRRVHRGHRRRRGRRGRRGGVGGAGGAPGNGLVGMRERAAALGGRVEAGPDPAGGFRVTAHLPRWPT